MEPDIVDSLMKIGRKNRICHKFNDLSTENHISKVINGKTISYKSCTKKPEYSNDLVLELLEFLANRD